MSSSDGGEENDLVAEVETAPEQVQAQHQMNDQSTTGNDTNHVDLNASNNMQEDIIPAGEPFLPAASSAVGSDAHSSRNHSEGDANPSSLLPVDANDNVALTPSPPSALRSTSGESIGSSGHRRGGKFRNLDPLESSTEKLAPLASNSGESPPGKGLLGGGVKTGFGAMMLAAGGDLEGSLDSESSASRTTKMMSRSAIAQRSLPRHALAKDNLSKQQHSPQQLASQLVDGQEGTQGNHLHDQHAEPAPKDENIERSGNEVGGMEPQAIVKDACDCTPQKNLQSTDDLVAEDNATEPVQPVDSIDATKDISEQGAEDTVNPVASSKPEVSKPEAGEAVPALSLADSAPDKSNAAITSPPLESNVEAPHSPSILSKLSPRQHPKSPQSSPRSTSSPLKGAGSERSSPRSKNSPRSTSEAQSPRSADSRQRLDGFRSSPSSSRKQMLFASSPAGSPHKRMPSSKIGSDHSIGYEQTYNKIVTDLRSVLICNSHDVTNTKEMVRSIFRRIDENNHGKLTAQEMKRFVLSPELGIFSEEDDPSRAVTFAELLMEQIDINGDGTISLSELEQFLWPPQLKQTLGTKTNSRINNNNTNESQPEDTYKEMGIVIHFTRKAVLQHVSSVAALGSDEAILKEFAQLAKAPLKRGMLETRLVKKAFANITIPQFQRKLHDYEVDQLVASLDCNEDGVLTSNEFKNWLFPSHKQEAMDQVADYIRRIVDNHFQGSVLEMHHAFSCGAEVLYKADFATGLNALDSHISKHEAADIATQVAGVGGKVISISRIESLVGLRARTASSAVIPTDSNAISLPAKSPVPVHRKIQPPPGPPPDVNDEQGAEHNHADEDDDDDDESTVTAITEASQLQFDSNVGGNHPSGQNHQRSLAAATLEESESGELHPPDYEQVVQTIVPQAETKPHEQPQQRNGPTEEEKEMVRKFLFEMKSQPTKEVASVSISNVSQDDELVSSKKDAVSREIATVSKVTGGGSSSSTTPHSGKFRGFPFDSWSCCNTNEKFCPAVRATNKSSIGSKAKAPGTGVRIAKRQIDSAFSVDDLENLLTRQSNQQNAAMNSMRSELQKIKEYSVAKEKLLRKQIEDQQQKISSLQSSVRKETKELSVHLQQQMKKTEKIAEKVPTKQLVQPRNSKSTPTAVRVTGKLDRSDSYRGGSRRSIIQSTEREPPQQQTSRQQVESAMQSASSANVNNSLSRDSIERILHIHSDKTNAAMLETLNDVKNEVQAAVAAVKEREDAMVKHISKQDESIRLLEQSLTSKLDDTFQQQQLTGETITAQEMREMLDTLQGESQKKFDATVQSIHDELQHTQQVAMRQEEQLLDHITSQHSKIRLLEDSIQSMKLSNSSNSPRHNDYASVKPRNLSSASSDNVRYMRPSLTEPRRSVEHTKKTKNVSPPWVPTLTANQVSHNRKGSSNGCSNSMSRLPSWKWEPAANMKVVVPPYRRIRRTASSGSMEGRVYGGRSSSVDLQQREPLSYSDTNEELFPHSRSVPVVDDFSRIDIYNDSDWLPTPVSNPASHETNQLAQTAPAAMQQQQLTASTPTAIALKRLEADQQSWWEQLMQKKRDAEQKAYFSTLRLEENQ